MEKLRILLTNDDGIFAKGIIELYQVLKDDFDVYVVAPETENSGFSHKITLRNPIETYKVLTDDIEGYAVKGTPADCVKIALQNLYKNKIDMVISGINRGSNNGVSVHYSGTVAAAIEGAFYKLPAIAISLYSFKDVKFREGAQFLKDFLLKHSDEMVKRKSLFNINIPENVDYEKYIFCAQGLGNFYEDYTEVEVFEKKYFWASGPGKELDESYPNDDIAILDNYITITPLKFDMTDNEELTFWNKN